MPRPPKVKMVYTSVPADTYDGLVQMAGEAELPVDQLVKSLLIELVEDDRAAHEEPEE
mgnify:CR=1 FL=1